MPDDIRGPESLNLCYDYRRTLAVIAGCGNLVDGGLCLQRKTRLAAGPCRWRLDVIPDHPIPFEQHVVADMTPADLRMGWESVGFKGHWLLPESSYGLRSFQGSNLAFYGSQPSQQSGRVVAADFDPLRAAAIVVVNKQIAAVALEPEIAGHRRKRRVVRDSDARAGWSGWSGWTRSAIEAGGPRTRKSSSTIGSCRTPDRVVRAVLVRHRYRALCCGRAPAWCRSPQCYRRSPSACRPSDAPHRLVRQQAWRLGRCRHWSASCRRPIDVPRRSAQRPAWRLGRCRRMVCQLLPSQLWTAPAIRHLARGSR